MKEFFKGIKNGYLLSGIIYTIVGLVLLIWPYTSVAIVCKAIGIVSIAQGVIHLIDYFRDTTHLLMKYNLFIGIFGLIIGFFLFFGVNEMMVIIPIIIGILLLIDGCMNIQKSFDLKRIGYSHWYVQLIMGALLMIGSIVLMVNPFGSATLLLRYVGVCLIVDGINEFVMAYKMKEKISDYEAFRKMMGIDIIEAETTNEREIH